MDTDLETQMGRVVVALRAAANRIWGPDDSPHSKDLAPDARTAVLAHESMKLGSNKSWVSGSETPLQKLVRDYLEQHPDAKAIEACRATGVSYTVCKLVKQRMIDAGKLAGGRKQ